MSFEVAPDAYAAFIGRYVEPLADRLVELVPLTPGARAVDVGCGPGTMTVRLAAQLGADHVLAVDPSLPLVEAARDRCPGVDIRVGVAEELPLPDSSVDLAVAQLVVHFMSDPVAGLREMARVTRPGGVVVATVWDHAGGRGPLSVFWSAACSVTPGTRDESEFAGAREGDLVRLMREAGLAEVTGGELTVRAEYGSFEEWWTPYTLGVGPGGDHVASLSAGARAALADACRERLPRPPFEISATAWLAVGTVPGGPPDVQRAVPQE